MNFLHDPGTGGTRRFVQSDMNRSIARSIAPLLIALALALAACGDDPSVPVSAGADDATPPADGETPSDTVVDLPDDVEERPEEDDAMLDTEIPNTPEPVSGVLTDPVEVVADPVDDRLIFARFVGGDPNCTAARLDVLSETPETVVVELVVGITDDALTRSCVAGEFDLRVGVQLSEPLGDRAVDWSSPASGDGDPVLVTPDLSTADFVGLPIAEAQELADANLLEWRITREDEEFFAVTADYKPGRLNLELDDGVVSRVTLG